MKILVFSDILWYNTSMDNKKDFGTSNTEMVTISRAEYENMQARIDWLTEQLLHAQRKVFGASSEKADEAVMDQLSLIFNEAEAYADGAEKAEKRRLSLSPAIAASGSSPVLPEIFSPRMQRKRSWNTDCLRKIGFAPNVGN